MKTLAIAAVLLLSAAAFAAPAPAPAKAAPKPKSALDCSTPGDALGGLSFMISGTTVTLYEYGMDGSTKTFKLEQTPLDPVNAAKAIAAGQAFNAFFRVKKGGAEFGGAIGDAGTISLGARVNGNRAGYLARQGSIYILQCLKQ